MYGARIVMSMWLYVPYKLFYLFLFIQKSSLFLTLTLCTYSSLLFWLLQWERKSLRCVCVCLCVCVCDRGRNKNETPPDLIQFETYILFFFHGGRWKKLLKSFSFSLLFGIETKSWNLKKYFSRFWLTLINYFRSKVFLQSVFLWCCKNALFAWHLKKILLTVQYQRKY